MNDFRRQVVEHLLVGESQNRARLGQGVGHKMRGASVGRALVEWNVCTAFAARGSVLLRMPNGFNCRFGSDRTAVDRL